MKAYIRHLIEPATIIELICVSIFCGGALLIVAGVGGGRPADRQAREVPQAFQIEARR